MLCQSMLGLSDEEIVQDYHQSELSSRAKKKANERRRGKLDRSVFGGAPRDAMTRTLQQLRSKHGSVSPGYLDSIGFTEDWRRRFVLSFTIVANDDNSDKVPSKL